MKVDLNGLCKDYGVRTVSYRSAQQVIHDHGMDQLANRTAGFRLFSNNQFFIFYDGERSSRDIRFTVAHELGHIILGHLDFRRKFWETLPDSAEREADAFAVQLLAHDLARRYEVPT